VQRPERPVGGEVEAGDAADAEHQLLPARLVDRPVGEQPGVGGEQRLVALEQRAQVRRPGLLLALEEELHVHRRPHAGVAERVERREGGGDGRLVVAGAAGVQAPLGAGGARPVGERHHAAAALERAVAQGGRERRRRPLGGRHRLAVVVGVEHHGAPRPRRAQLAVHGGRAAGRALEQPQRDAAPGERGHDGVGVAADVRRVARHVGQGEEGGELAQHLVVVPGAPGADPLDDGAGDGGRARRVGGRRGGRLRAGPGAGRGGERAGARGREEHASHGRGARRDADGHAAGGQRPVLALSGRADAPGVPAEPGAGAPAAAAPAGAVVVSVDWPARGPGGGEPPSPSLDPPYESRLPSLRPRQAATARAARAATRIARVRRGLGMAAFGCWGGWGA
jgi:hypothetical protein